MEEQIVKFETAQLAKEKGFDAYCRDWFFIADKESLEKQPTYYRNKALAEYVEIDGKFVATIKGGEKGKSINEKYKNSPDTPRVVAAPTQELLKKWLREVYKISIKVDDFYTNSKVRYDYSIGKLGSQDDNPKGAFEGYEEAFEKGLLKALKSIKDAS